jgi:hypothetical protein
MACLMAMLINFGDNYILSEFDLNHQWIIKVLVTQSQPRGFNFFAIWPLSKPLSNKK